MVEHGRSYQTLYWNTRTFDKQNLVTFEDTLKYKGDLLFVSYCDFETTAPTDYYLDPKNKVIFAI